MEFGMHGFDNLSATDRDLPVDTPMPIIPARFGPIRWCGIIIIVLAVAGEFAVFPELLQPQNLPSFAGVFATDVLAFLGIVSLLQTSSLAARAATIAADDRSSDYRGLAWLWIAAGVAGSLLIVWVLRAFPNSGDEYDYLFQAQTFLAGRLWNPVPPDHEFFAFAWQTFQDGKWTTLYPPGWPGLLAMIMALRLPVWLAPPLAGGVLLFALFKLGQRRSGALAGVFAVALVAISPFFLFNAASYFMHVPAAAAGLLFCWAAVDFLDEPRLSKGCLAGAALGLLGLIRPEDVPLFALPFAGAFLLRARRQHYRHAPAIIVSGLPFLIALLMYNHAIMGSTIPDPGKYYPSFKFGLYSVDQFGNHFTPVGQLRFVIKRMIMLVQWTSLPLVLGYAAAFVWIAPRRRLSFLDFVFPLFVLGFMLFPAFGGDQYGPRYYFDAFPFLVLTVVSAVAPILQDAAHPRRPALAIAAMAHGMLCIAGIVGLGIAGRTVVDQRMDLYDQVKAAGLHDAVVVVRSPTGRVLPIEPKGLTRNGIALDGKVVYALDIPHRLSDLWRLFPNRRFYVYARKFDSVKGTLGPLPDKGTQIQPTKNPKNP